MTYKATIGIVVAVITLLFAGTINGVEMKPAAVDRQMARTGEYVEIKCDPCDYNIDYGNTYGASEKGGVDEGTVRLKCDPCDYNIDYGKKDHPIKH